jgi:hypothetical protein
VAAIQQVLFAGSGAATVSDALIREDGFYVLREDDGKILLEANVGDLLLREDGFYVLREDDGRVLLEGTPASEVPSTAFLDTNGLPLLRTDGDYILEV